MMKRAVMTAVLAAAAFVGVPSAASADFVLTFDQSNYNVTVGETVNVNVFIEETGGSVLNNDGLITASLRVFFNEPTRVSDPAQVNNVTANTDFDFSGFDITPATGTTTGNAYLLEGVILSDPVTSPGGDPNRLFLGTFQFEAGDIENQVTNIRVGLFNTSSSFANFVDGNGNVLDGQITGSTATITAQAIPEPASMLLVGLAAVGGAGTITFRRRRARKATTAAVA